MRIDYDLYWEANEEEIKRWKTCKAGKKLQDYKPNYRPTLVLQNCVDLKTCEEQMQPEGTAWVMRTEDQTTKDEEVVFGRGRMMNMVRYEVRGVFQQKMNTIHYPFDCQVLEIHMSIQHATTKHVKLLPCKKFKTEKDVDDAFTIKQRYNAIQEWDIISDGCNAEVNGGLDDGEGKYPWLVCRITVRRIPWVFLWKYEAVLSFLTWCAVAAYSIEIRTSMMFFLMTCMLTINVLHNAVNADLPPCPLPSFADTTFICGKVFTSTLIFVAAFLPEDEVTDTLRHLDRVRLISPIVLGVMHVVFLYWAVTAYNRGGGSSKVGDVKSVIKDNY